MQTEPIELRPRYIGAAGTEGRVVSCGIRRLLAATAWGCLIAVMPRVGASQPAGDSATADAKSEIADKILEAQQQGGPYSAELIDPLTVLSLLYVEDGQHALAVGAIDQALQVMRANYGLRSLEQAPLLRQRIISEESRGNFAEAWELEQDLLTLAGRNLDDSRSASIFHELGDKRMELRDRFLAGEWPPQVVLGCYYEGSQSPMNDSRNCLAGSRDGAARRMLYDAQRNYLKAVKVLVGQQAYSSSLLYELEAKFLRNSYTYRGYENGRQSLRRSLSYDVANAAPMTTRIDKLLQLADWDLLFDHRPPALELYAQIHAFLQQQPATPESIEQVFSPVVPIALPAFASNPFAPELAEASTGYVDVAFDITQFGTTRRVDVLDTRNASDDAQDRLVSWIVQTHFRPQVKDGRFSKATRVVARAYLRE